MWACFYLFNFSSITSKMVLHSKRRNLNILDCLVRYIISNTPKTKALIYSMFHCLTTNVIFLLKKKTQKDGIYRNFKMYVMLWMPIKRRETQKPFRQKQLIFEPEPYDVKNTVYYIFHSYHFI